jgi:hypothetical protein
VLESIIDGLDVWSGLRNLDQSILVSFASVDAGLARTSGPGKLHGLVLAVKGHDELRNEWGVVRR